MLLVLGLILVFYLLMLVGGIMVLVAAFRQNIWWGLACLFVPFASLAFCIAHWQEAKTGFLLAVTGFGVSLGLLLSVPAGRAALAKTELGRHIPFLDSTPKKSPAEELRQQIADKRNELVQLKNDYASLDADVTRQYQALTASRQALNTADQAAVHKFNTDAAAYQQQNARLKQLKADIATGEQAISDLLDQQAKQKEVVMYTTSICPVCKMAKAYFERKGVAYREINVEDSQENYEEFKRLGGNGVPLIIVGDKKMEGFNEQALDEML